MGLPDKPVKKIPKHQLPVGARKGNKLKVQDGTTGKVSWRQSARGFKRDYDGDATSKDYNRADFKPSHRIHGGKLASDKHDMPKDRRMPELPEDG